MNGATQGDLMGFFDMVGVGKIIHSFTTDVDYLEDNLIYSMNDTIVYFSIVLADFVFILIAIRFYFIPFIIIFLILIFYLQHKMIIMQNKINANNSNH